MLETTVTTADIPPGPAPTQPRDPVATTSQPLTTAATTPASTSGDWSGGAIAIAVVAILALVVAVVAISVVIARRSD